MESESRKKFAKPNIMISLHLELMSWLFIENLLYCGLKVKQENIWNKV